MSNQQQSTPNWGSNLRVPLRGRNHDSLFLYVLRTPWPNITITHSKWLITYRNIACQRVYLVEFNGCTGTLLYFDHEQPHPVDGNYGHIDFCMRAGVNNKKKSSPRKHPYPRIFNCDLFKTIVHNQQGRKMSYGTFSHSLTLGLTCRIPELGECVFNQDLLPLFRKACFRLRAAHNISIDPSLAIRGRGTGQWWRGWQADMEWKDNYDLRRRYIPFNVFLFWLVRVVEGESSTRSTCVLKGLRLP